MPRSWSVMDSAVVEVHCEANRDAGTGLAKRYMYARGGEARQVRED